MSNKPRLTDNFKITVKRVFYGEKFGGDDVHAEIYKGDEIVGKVFSNSYLNKIRGVDLRMSDKNNNDERAYFYPDKILPFEEQILDSINSIIFIIAKNDKFFKVK